MTDYKKWTDYSDEHEILWVCGGIDAYGSVIGHVAYDNGFASCHTAAEKAISSWRFEVSSQDFMNHFMPPKRQLTIEEFHSVQNWLVKNGYADDESFEF